jgi:hypothetical protein
MNTPATTAIVRWLRSSRGGIHARHAALALAVLADDDLNSPHGLDVIPAERVAHVVGLARSTMERTLRGLAADETAPVVVIVSYAATRHAYTGRQAERLPRGARVLGYRPSEEVYR